MDIPFRGLLHIGEVSPNPHPMEFTDPRLRGSARLRGLDKNDEDEEASPGPPRCRYEGWEPAWVVPVPSKRLWDPEACSKASTSW